jgi:hypothetical protein
LDRYWGKWEATGGTVTFDDPKIADSFNYHVRQIQFAGQAQVEAQRKLVSLR